MIKLEYAGKNEIQTDRAEVLRYLGYKRGSGAEIPLVVDECINEIHTALQCKACYDRFKISEKEHGTLNLGFAETSSAALRKNLRGCDEIIVFTATIGFEVDRIIQKYSILSPAHAVTAQAAGAAAIEKWCDLLCERFKQRCISEKRYLRPRFSPGYGDLSIKLQSDIIHILDCTRKIGVSLTDSLIMLPGKSVSAIIGISDKDIGCRSGCEVCENTQCEFRRT